MLWDNLNDQMSSRKQVLFATALQYSLTHTSLSPVFSWVWWFVDDGISNTYLCACTRHLILAMISFNPMLWIHCRSLMTLEDSDSEITLSLTPKRVKPQHRKPAKGEFIDNDRYKMKQYPVSWKTMTHLSLESIPWLLMTWWCKEPGHRQICWSDSSRIFQPQYQMGQVHELIGPWEIWMIFFYSKYFQVNWRLKYFKLTLVIDDWGISCEICPQLIVTGPNWW